MNMSHRPDYARIAQMEWEIYGEAYDHKGGTRPPVKPSNAPRPGELWTMDTYEAYSATAQTSDPDGLLLTQAINDGALINLGVGRPKQKRANRQ
jgi:hypothetical protein